MSNDLKQWAKDNTKFLKILNGETFEGFYMGFNIVPNTFDPDKQSIQYKLKYTDCENIVYWTNGSTSVANAMSNFEEGDVITISRTGSGTHDTKYEIKRKGE